MGPRIIVSASSDIGGALAHHWRAAGHPVVGTYRTASAAVDALEHAGISLVPCDLSDTASVRAASAALIRSAPAWDVLVLAPGALEPVGRFLDCDFEEWAASLTVNLTNQLRLIHALLPARSRGTAPGPLVLLFAGSGSNGAAPGYSAYTVSKIALTKMCELLDAELPDTRFAILGPGWVRTKIHQATLRAGARAGVAHRRTLDMLAGGAWTPMAEVLACCDWLATAPRAVVGGRNFSTVHDRWGSAELTARLARDGDLYKLRRAGNDALPRAHD